MSKYIIDIDDNDIQKIVALGVTNCGAVYTRKYDIDDDIEELTIDYIKENCKSLLNAEYQRGFEEGKAANDKGCEGCKYQANKELTCPCSECANNFKNQWTAKDDKIEVGDEVEWDGDKYIVTYLNKGINTGEIQDYDVMGADGSVVDHVSRCAITKTGRHFDIDKILDEMKGTGTDDDTY